MNIIYQNKSHHPVATFFIAYVINFIIIFSYFLLKEHLYILFNILSNSQMAASYYQDLIATDFDWFNAFLSPIFLPVMSTIISFRYPKYLLILLAYLLITYIIYRIQYVFKTNRLLILTVLLLILNGIGLQIYPKLLPDLIA